MKRQAHKLKILFIEDCIADAELAVLRLEREGYSIDWQRVQSEAALRATLIAWEPELILSDYTLPGFNGLAALAICREMVPQIPFIFLSGTIGEEQAIESIYQGATDYVLKENMRRLSTSIDRAMHDTNEKKRLQVVEKERSRLSAILESTSDIVVIAQPDELITYMNQGAQNLLGIGRATTSLRVGNLHPLGQWPLIHEQLLADVAQRGLWQGDALLVGAGGVSIPVSLVVICHRDEEKRVEYFSFIARDIRERRAFEKQIQYLANFDSLTGLPNRTLLADRVTQALGFSHWGRRHLALLIINVDRFKLVNDGYGQAFGDALLREFGMRLQETVRGRDTVARIAADSFAVLAAELSSPDDVIVVVGKLQESMGRPFMIGQRVLNVSTSIGISLYPRDGLDFETLYHHADVALHRQKESGDGGYQFYSDEMTRNAVHQVRIESELQQALDTGQLRLNYQVQVALESGKAIGFEALVRWQHPEQGLLLPGEFIAIAEKSELIHGLGEWVLNTACKQLKEWDGAGNTPLRMAVNVSARQFRRKGFVQMVENALKATGLEPQRLELELTESVLIDDKDESAAILQQLATLGVSITLDDFGTGYCSLSYLSRLPIDCLKIDKSFVQRALLDHGDAEIVRAIISLTETLGLRVIAEGIETPEQLEWLRHNNCSEGQGYLFSRPVPAAEINPLWIEDTP
ncbi:MAG: EAL domain-containing protein [Pseudomonadota bacterium]